MTTILTIDIGGSKTEAALWQSSCTQPKLLQKCRFATNFSDEAGLLEQMTALPVGADTEAAVLAVAGRGANADGFIRLTNNPCTLNISRLQAMLPAGIRLAVLNDLEALAHALPYLPAGSLQSLNDNADMSLLAAPYPRIAAACGTGFGAAALLPGGRVLPTEFGHARFAPADSTQAELCRGLDALTNALTNEDILSGRGLSKIYAAQNPTLPPLSPQQITQTAKDDNAAAAAVKSFAQMLGAALGNLALCFLPGGIYLAGGVCRNMAGLLQSADITAGLVIPGPFAAYLQSLPVMLITEASPTLLGAVMYAERFLLG